MQKLQKRSLAQLPEVRALGRHAGRDPLTLFWTASGIELDFTGSELWVDFFADYEIMEPWVSVELNGAWLARFAVNPGESRVCLFRGMAPGKKKHVRLLKDVQAMHDDPAHLLQITGLEYTGGSFESLPEPKYRLEFVGDSITSGEGAIGAVPEEDWVGAFFSAENHYARMTADALGAEYRCISQSGWGIGMLGTRIAPVLRQGVEQYKTATGDTRAYLLELPEATPQTMGARQHPGAACHRQAAQVLTTFLRTIL